MLVKETSKVNESSVEFLNNPKVEIVRNIVYVYDDGEYYAEIPLKDIEAVTLFGENTLSISTSVGRKALIWKYQAEPVYTKITSKLPEEMKETEWNY